MRVLIACEFSGTVRDAFRARGHYAVSCDLLPTEVEGPHFRMPVEVHLKYHAHEYDLLIGHPPCTVLANSGVRWLYERPERWSEMDGAAAFYRLLRDAPIPLKAIENPIMHKHARALVQPGPRQVVQPWWFGDEAFKATGLELIGLPPLVPTNKLTPPLAGTPEHKRWSAIHRAAPGPDRWKIRSRTFPGIAAAMADQWGGLALERVA